MNEMRLIDANNLGIGEANPDLFERRDYAFGWNSALQAITNASPTIDPETLPIVRELRDENIKSECRADALMAKILVLEEQLKQVTAERDKAISQLHGYCLACKNFSQNRFDGPCSECKHEYYAYRGLEVKDNWEWNGLGDTE